MRSKPVYKAVFIDKDGTLIPDVPYNANPALVCLMPMAAQSLRQLQEAGYLLIVISNQSGIAFGYFTEDALLSVNTAIQQLLQPYRVQIDAFYYCPHHPQGKIAPFNTVCNCRKPADGLLQKAAVEMNIDLNQSWMIGDILNDTEAGNTAGCCTILLSNGNETEWLMNAERMPDYTINNWHQVAGIIINTTEFSTYDQLESL